MDILPVRWERIAPGWYHAAVESPAGTAKVWIERQTRFRIYACRIDYPSGRVWGQDRPSLRAAKIACEVVLLLTRATELGWQDPDPDPDPAPTV